MFMKHKFERAVELYLHTPYPIFYLRVFFCRRNNARASRDNGVAPKPVCTEKRRHIKIFAAYAP